MKVIEKKNSNLVKMSDIEQGDCFKKGEGLYMRVEDSFDNEGLVEYTRYVCMEGHIWTRPINSDIEDCQKVKAHVEYEIID